jgi:hypothetical protein
MNNEMQRNGRDLFHGFIKATLQGISKSVHHYSTQISIYVMPSQLVKTDRRFLQTIFSTCCSFYQILNDVGLDCLCPTRYFTHLPEDGADFSRNHFMCNARQSNKGLSIIITSLALSKGRIC